MLDQDQLIHLGLELELELTRGTPDADALGDQDEMADTFDHLQVRIAQRRWDQRVAQRAVWDDEAELDVVLVHFAKQQLLALAWTSERHVVAYAGNVVEPVQRLEAPLEDLRDAADDQCSVSVPLIGTMPRSQSARTTTLLPVFNQRS